MSDAPATRLSLLVRLCDARDDGAWAQFVEIYAPLVYGYARKHGLQDADAADLTQDVLQAVSGAHSPARLRSAPRLVSRLAVHRGAEQAAQLPRRPEASRTRQRRQRRPALAQRIAGPRGRPNGLVGCRSTSSVSSPGPPSRCAAASPNRPGRRSGKPRSRARQGRRRRGELRHERGRRLPRQGPGDGAVEGTHPRDTRRIRVAGREP